MTIYAVICIKGVKPRLPTGIPDLINSSTMFWVVSDINGLNGA